MIEGYASVFGNADTGGDTVAPGAFKNSLALRAAAADAGDETQTGFGFSVGREPDEFDLDRAARVRPVPHDPARLGVLLPRPEVVGDVGAVGGRRRRQAEGAEDAAGLGAGLGATEIGQHLGIGPAAQAELAPVVVIGGLAPHRDHGVDGGGATDHLAAGIGQRAAV